MILSLATTICNLNLVKKSAVSSLPRGSEEYLIVQNICRNKIVDQINASAPGKWTIYKEVLSNV